MAIQPGTIEESTIPDPMQKSMSALDEQITNAERMLSGEDIRMAMAGRYGMPVPTTQELRKEISNARIQRSMLEQHQELYNQIQLAESRISDPDFQIDTQSLENAKAVYEQNKPLVEALTSKELSPFIELDNKGVRIDVKSAVNAGVSKDLLKKVGVSGGAQQIVKIKLRKEKEGRKSFDEIPMSEASRRYLLREEDKLQRQLKTFEANNTKLGDGRYMSNTDFEKLTPIEKGIAKGSGGFSALQKYWIRTSTPKLSLPIDAKQLYDKSGPEDKFAILKSYGKLPENAQYTGSKAGDPMYRIGDGIDTFVMSGFTDFIVESTVPLVRTISKWDEMSAGDRALSIAFDALFFIPFIGAASRAAKGSVAVTRAGRLAAATRGIGNELLLQAKAPIDIMLHPVQTVKGVGKGAWNVLENIGNLPKIPEASVSNTFGTLRIPVLAGWSPDDALRARQQLLSAIEKSGGKAVTLELNGYRFTFSPGALMRESRGLSHATPQGEAFLHGIKVKSKPGMPMTEQGIFVSPETLPRFTKSAAFGQTGNMPTIFITSSDTAKDAIGTSKIYKSKFGKVAELEKKFPVDYEIPEPKQILYTRLGPELTKTLIMLETPLSKAQILKLKSLAIIENLKAPFKPSLLIQNTNKIKGAKKFVETIDAREIRELTRMLERSGNRNVARNLRAVWNGLNNAREVTRRETMEATRGRGSARIGVGTISVRSRTGAADPERVMFNISAEKIGRTATPEKLRSPVPIRITNRETLRQKSSRSKTTTSTSPRVTVKDTEEVTPTSRVRRDSESNGDRGISRIPRKDEEPKRKVYKPRTQKESRKRIREAKIAVGWRQGQLHGKHRYDVITDPFTPAEEYLIIMGKRPQGVKLVRGPRSAYNSAQTLSGKLGKAGIVDIPGIMHVKMWPEGKKQIGLQFGRDANISNRKRVFPLSRREVKKE